MVPMAPSARSMAPVSIAMLALDSRSLVLDHEHPRREARRFDWIIGVDRVPIKVAAGPLGLCRSLVRLPHHRLRALHPGSELIGSEINRATRRNGQGSTIPRRLQQPQ